MGQQKKSSKAGRQGKSKSGTNYKASNRRFANKLRKVRRHIKKYPNELKAQRWLRDVNALLSSEYTRGSPAVKKLHEGVYG